LTSILDALQKNNGNKLLAPTVITKSGSPVEIKVVKEVSYPTQAQSTTLTNVSFETRDVGVILTATPSVGPDKEVISLVLTPKVVLADWLPEDSAVVKFPVFRSYEAVIPISIRDGQTVVMSGVKPEVEHDKNFLIFVTAGRVEAAQNHR